MFQKLVRFRRTRAAITTDLVALAAALVLLKFVVANSIYGGVFLELFRLSAHGHPAEQIQSMIFNGARSRLFAASGFGATILDPRSGRYIAHNVRSQDPVEAAWKLFGLGHGAGSTVQPVAWPGCGLTGSGWNYPGRDAPEEGGSQGFLTVEIIRAALETAGIEIIEENAGGPDVRLRNG